MRSVEAVLMALAFGVSSAASQAPSTTNPDLNSAQPIQYVTFWDDLLDFGFTYPASMVPMELPSPEQQHAQNAMTAKQTGMRPECLDLTDTALMASYNERRTRWSGENKTLRGITATFWITRVGLSCIDPEIRKNFEISATAIPQLGGCGGNMLYRYLLPKHRVGNSEVYFGATESADRDAHEGRIWRAEAQFVSAESLIMIEVYSNDHDYLNQIVRGQLKIGQQDPKPLLATGFNPSEIHSPDIVRCDSR